MQSSTTVKTTATTRGLSTASTASRTSGTLAKSSTTGDVSTASTTFTTTMQSNTADGCDSWCVGHAQSWEDKCTWDTCNTCPECPGKYYVLFCAKFPTRFHSYFRVLLVFSHVFCTGLEYLLLVTCCAALANLFHFHTSKFHV